MDEDRKCPNEEKHISHQWGINHGDMGTIWYECPGLGYWDVMR